MATGNITKTTADKFIPEYWSPEIRAYLKAKLVLANLVKMVSFVGKKGDKLHIPDVTEMTASAKAASTDVTFKTFTENEFTMDIDKHEESSFRLEDIVEVQSAYNLRSEYTMGAGYALAKDIDSLLHSVASVSKNIGGDGVTAWSGSANGNAGNGTDITDDGFRRAIETLDTLDVPGDDRSLVIHPSQKNVLLGIDRFTEYQFLGDGSAIRTGAFGELYGVKVYVSTQCPQLLADDASTAYRENFFLQKNAVILAMQRDVRTQAAYNIRALAWEVVVDVIFGIKLFRSNHCMKLVTPA